MHDLTAHDGNVWTIIYSLHREDARAAWLQQCGSQAQAALSVNRNKFAERFMSPASALHWYAAYHDTEMPPHPHDDLDRSGSSFGKAGMLL